MNQAFFVDVFVKNATAPGVHTGSVTVHMAGASPPLVLPLSIKVFVLAVPTLPV